MRENRLSGLGGGRRTHPFSIHIANSPSGRFELGSRRVVRNLPASPPSKPRCPNFSAGTCPRFGCTLQSSDTVWQLHGAAKAASCRRSPNGSRSKHGSWSRCAISRSWKLHEPGNASVDFQHLTHFRFLGQKHVQILEVETFHEPKNKAQRIGGHSDSDCLPSLCPPNLCAQIPDGRPWAHGP